MVSQLPKTNATEVFYPDSDGQPIASNTEQYRWIVTIQQNLDWLLENSFVAGYLFWYPIEGRSDISVAPDVMDALTRPKGKRIYYKHWVEDNIPPQVVFEILSPSNTRREMDSKLLFFERHGVEEYYIYDTERDELSGFTRGELGLTPIEDIYSDWVSPLLNIRFDMSGDELQLLRPDGTPFSTYREVLEQKVELAEQKALKLAEKLRELGVDPDQL